MLGTTVTLYNTLDELGIDYTEVTHPAVTTMEAAQFVRTLIDGTPIKNLFLTNRKGNYYLVLMSEDRRADLKALAQIIGTGRLSFANADDLRRVLNLEPGSVTRSHSSTMPTNRSRCWSILRSQDSVCSCIRIRTRRR